MLLCGLLIVCVFLFRLHASLTLMARESRESNDYTDVTYFWLDSFIEVQMLIKKVFSCHAKYCFPSTKFLHQSLIFCRHFLCRVIFLVYRGPRFCRLYRNPAMICSTSSHCQSVECDSKNYRRPVWVIPDWCHSTQTLSFLPLSPLDDRGTITACSYFCLAWATEEKRKYALLQPYILHHPAKDNWGDFNNISAQFHGRLQSYCLDMSLVWQPINSY